MLERSPININKSAISTFGNVLKKAVISNTIIETGLTPLTVNHIVKRCAQLAKLDFANKISPHSLRRGLATSAARVNTPIHVIMRAGRWKQVNTVMEYIEANERFTENASVNILNKLKNKTHE